MTKREQVIAVVAAIAVVFYLIYRAGLGSMLDELTVARSDLAGLREECQTQRDQLRDFQAVAEEYESYANYSLLEAEGDPADVFSNYVFNTLIECGVPSPRLSPTEEEEIEDVPNYVQILLPVEFTAEFDLLVRALGTFARQRLLIRSLDISSTVDDNEAPLSVKLTLTRFVRIAAEEGEESEG
ncbi:hypothetical protein JXA47_09620 [Candidatus Sumerlaeota bacterium]|nr:hypothetical protein [Candidatus Sumerlaeota bacterium]